MEIKKGIPYLAALMLGASSTNLYAAAGHWTDGAVEVSINESTITGLYERPIPQTLNLNWDAGLLYTESTASRGHNAQVAHLGVQAIETDYSQYRAGLGMRIQAYTLSDSDQIDDRLTGLGLSFGGQFYHTLPGYPRVSAGIYGWVAPTVTSIGSTDLIFDAGARMTYRIINGGDIFGGYRATHLDRSEFSGAVDEGLHLGFRLKL